MRKDMFLNQQAYLSPSSVAFICLQKLEILFDTFGYSFLSAHRYSIRFPCWARTTKLETHMLAKPSAHVFLQCRSLEAHILKREVRFELKDSTFYAEAIDVCCFPMATSCYQLRPRHWTESHSRKPCDSDGTWSAGFRTRGVVVLYS